MKLKKEIRFEINVLLILFLILIVFCPFLCANEKDMGTLDIMQVIDRCLAANYNIRQKELQVNVANGFLQQMRGSFDFSIYTNMSYAHQIENKVIGQKNNDIINAEISLNQLLANGFELSASINNRRIVNNPDIPLGFNYSTLDFSITIPLLKNSGKDVVYANVSAAKSNLKEEKYNLQNQIRLSIMQALSAYWKYVAGKLILEERKKAELRAKNLVDDTEELIRRDEVAPSEIMQYQGNLGNKIVARLAQEQALYEVKLNLGKLLGMSIEECINLTAPNDNFPDLENLHINHSSEIIATILSDAQKKRSDYLAIIHEKESAQVRFSAAKKNTRPDLNLTFDVGYNGFKYGSDFSSYLNSITAIIPGANVNVGITFIWPIANNLAEGNFKQQYYALQQIMNKENELLTNIKKDIMVYYKQIDRLIQQFSFIKQAVQNYGIALENEKIKYKMNMSTQMTIIETEDRFIEAAIGEISIKEQLLTALLNFLYSSGDLGHFKNETFVINKNELIDLPHNIIE